jgi:hypothetical protein
LYSLHALRDKKEARLAEWLVVAAALYTRRAHGCVFRLVRYTVEQLNNAKRFEVRSDQLGDTLSLAAQKGLETGHQKRDLVDLGPYSPKYMDEKKPRK